MLSYPCAVCKLPPKTVPLGTLCCVAVSYDGDTRCIAAINGTVTVKEAPAYVYPHEPQRFILGGTEAAADAGTLPGVRLVAAHRFNFALTAEELTTIWNGGHPELWVVPAVVRNIEPSQWPSGSFTASAGTWMQNNSATSITRNVSAANGFFRDVFAGDKQHPRQSKHIQCLAFGQQAGRHEIHAAHRVRVPQRRRSQSDTRRCGIGDLFRPTPEML